MKKLLEENPELMKEIEGKILEHKDELLGKPKKDKKKSKLEEAAAKAAGGAPAADDAAGDVPASGVNADEDLEISAEDDFEEFTPV